MKVKVIAFDIFGTLVDWWSGIANQVNRTSREKRVSIEGGKFAEEWRARYIPSMDLVRKGELEWMNLDGLHRRSLDQLLVEFNANSLDEETRGTMVHFWHHLPPWKDVQEGLTRLSKKYTLAALSNGGFALLTSLAKEGNLDFDCIISAELFKHYKPDKEVYQGAASLLEAKPEETLMVASHIWDLDGARNAGLETCFVERPLEKGPKGRADRLSNATRFNLGVHDFLELAKILGC